MMHLDDAMMSMGHCTGQGMEEMRTHWHGMGRAVDQHLESLGEARDIASAHEACTRHTDAMDATIDHMDRALCRAGCM